MMFIFQRAAIFILFLIVGIAAENNVTSNTVRMVREISAKPVFGQGEPKKRAKKQPSKKGKGGEDKEPSINTDMERVLSEARTTLVNVDLSSLSTEEYLFFEDALRDAYESVYGVTVNAVIVKDAIQPSAGAGVGAKKGLRGGKKDGDKRGRDLTMIDYGIFFWFDIYALLEFTCTLCDPDDDDTFFNNRNLEEKVHSPEKKLRLEDVLCASLRGSDFESLQNVEECQVLMA